MDIHDYEIVGIESNRVENTLSLTLCSPDLSTRWIVEISGVAKFFVDGMQMQNVIFEVETFNQPVSSHRYWRACKLLDIESDSEIDFQSFQLTIFEASVGAEIAVLSALREISLRQLNGKEERGNCQGQHLSAG